MKRLIRKARRIEMWHGKAQVFSLDHRYERVKELEEEYEDLLDGESPSEGLNAKSLDLLNQLGGDQDIEQLKYMNDMDDEDLDDLY